MYKVDLHTHSTDSPDGGISAEQYSHAINTGVVDYVAVTDHNSIAFAKKLQEALGDRIVVGEEIMTTAGEIIGLYLNEPVAPNMNPIDTIRAIKDQGGLVYIPHPLETMRKGLQINVLEELIEYIDFIEVGNGRAIMQSKYSQILVWANLNHLIAVASSDAHGYTGLGQTYTSISEIPNKQNLKGLLLRGRPIVTRPSLRALLYPKYNRLYKRFS